MTGIPDTCNRCGIDTSGRCAFVDYAPDPSEGQAETAWGQRLPVLKVVVCRECGYALAAFDPSEVGTDETTGDYRVDHELT